MHVHDLAKVQYLLSNIYFDFQSESLQLLKEFCLLVRTLNFHVSLQDYTIIFLTPLKNLGRIVDNLDIGDDMIQLGVCNFYDSL